MTADVQRELAEALTDDVLVPIRMTVPLRTRPPMHTDEGDRDA